jgi:hypothetical protein
LALFPQGTLNSHGERSLALAAGRKISQNGVIFSRPAALLAERRTVAPQRFRGRWLIDLYSKESFTIRKSK